jgi:hypothetical protein
MFVQLHPNRAFAQEAITGGTIREKLRPKSFESHWATVFCMVYTKINQSHTAGKAGLLMRALHHFVAVGDEGAGRIEMLSLISLL